jgi:DNA-binding MarR family transcriptional regulator
MSSQGARHSELVDALMQEFRRSSGGTVLFHHGVAERLGLNPSDLKCLDLVCGGEPMTAGQLAELAGLTTGAITGVLDRLEKAGYARRERDPNDRRRIFIQPIYERLDREVAPLFAPLAEATIELCSHYTEEELALILDFLRRTQPLMQQQIERLRAERPDAEQP